MGYTAFRLKLALVAIMSIIPLVGFSDFTIRSRHIRGANYLYLDDVANYYGMTLTNSDDTIRLHSDHYDIRLVAGDRRLTVNSVRAYCSFIPRIYKNRPVISETDMTLLIDPIVRTKSLPNHPVRRIVIDPGHGGKDHGAIGSLYQEKNINLLIANQLKQLLNGKGYDIRLTRDTDSFISLKQRGIFTRNCDGDLFVSIHCNAAGASSVSGVETFIVTPQGAPSTSKSSVQKTSVSGNEFDKLNARLAYEIHRRLIDDTKARDRGIKYYRYQVLREASCPAVLIETGFLSNPSEQEKLGNSAYQQMVAISIANGIISFHNALIRRSRYSTSSH